MNGEDPDQFHFESSIIDCDFPQITQITELKKLFLGWKPRPTCSRSADGSWEVQLAQAEEHGWKIALQNPYFEICHLDLRICSHSQWPFCCSSCNWNDCCILCWCHWTSGVDRFCEKQSWSSNQHSQKTCQMFFVTPVFFIELNMLDEINIFRK